MVFCSSVIGGGVGLGAVAPAGLGAPGVAGFGAVAGAFAGAVAGALAGAVAGTLAGVFVAGGVCAANRAGKKSKRERIVFRLTPQRLKKRLSKRHDEVHSGHALLAQMRVIGDEEIDAGGSGT